MLEKIKKYLRISNNAFDEEINDLIETAKSDLIISGVTETKANDETDSLIIRAIIIYCKAHFGWNNPDSEKLQKSYDMLKIHLALSTEYNTEFEVVV